MRPKLKAERRLKFTGSTLRSLRKSGRLPGIVYGKHVGNCAVHVPLKEIRRWAELGHSELIELEIEGVGTYPVVMKEVQRDRITGEWLHVDFHQVSLDEPVRVKVPLEYRGTPAGARSGGVLQIQEKYLEVEALPEHIPAVIDVDVSGLDVGDKLTVADLVLPPNVKAIAQPDELLVSLVMPLDIDDEEIGEPAAEAQEAS